MGINFKGKRILVTGAGAGIGKLLAQTLASMDAEVIGLSLIQGELDRLKEETPSIQTVCVDLCDWRTAQEVIRNLGPLDGLVNNAGIAEIASLLDVNIDDFDKTYKVNVKAVVAVTQVVARGMVDNKIKGSIVNVSSVAAKTALEDHVFYCGSKAAVDQSTKVMALELGKYNIRVNSVNPTVTMTELGSRIWSDPAKKKNLTERIPLGRFAEVNEVVNAIIFLLSDLASMITGTNMPVDGGQLVI